MRSVSILAPVAAAAALSGCVSATSVPSFKAVEQKYIPLAEAVYLLATIPNPDGDDLGRIPNNTLYANLPDGKGVYSGLILGDDLCHAGNDPDNCAGPAVEFLAKLSLNANYDNQEVTGSLSEFVTKLANFKNPAGTIVLNGAICDNGSLGSAACDGSEPDGFVYIALEGSGELIGANGNKALYWFKAGSPSGADLGADGAFGGDTGQVIAGSFGSDFQWLDGIYFGISGSDGNWVALRQ